VPLHITSATIEAAVGLGVEQGSLEEDDQSMIQGALDAAETRVREIMTPRPYVVWLPDSVSIRDVLHASAGSGYSRVPLYRGTVDDIAGVVYVRDLLPAVLCGNLHTPAAAIARAPQFVPETKLVSELLQEMREHGIPLAIVLDEYGGTCGLVTLEDVVEEIVGDIADEFDEVEFNWLPVDGGYLLAGRYAIREANESLQLSLPEPPDVDTVGGLVYALAGRIPSVGDSVQAGEWVLTVDEVRGSRILKVRAERGGVEEGLAEPGAGRGATR
jgi:putative hemolysin